MKTRRADFRKASGFSLLEMAVVLTIVGLLIAGLLPALSVQIEIQRIKDTRKQVEEIKEALVGYATINGRLPCPASATSNGLESFCSNANGACGNEVLSPAPAHGRCSSPYNGFVPAATLGLSPVDAQGYMIDAWSNRIRYAVSTASVASVYTFTAPGAMRAATIANLKSDLYVCASSPNAGNPSQSATSCGTAATLTSTAPAVIYSIGKNGGSGGSSPDELANANPFTNPGASPNSYEDRVFVSHDPTATFDDIVTWISPNILIGRMVAVGQLP